MDNKSLADRISQLSIVGNGAVPNVPLVEIIADKRVLIENHMGVCCYSREQIAVKASVGFYKICGKCLYLEKMTNDQLVIVGQIEDIHICRGDRL